MDIFTINNNKLDIIPENLNIPEFLAIWERDQSSNKLTAKSELLYVYHMVSFKSIYRDFPEDKKEYCIIKDFIKIKDWQADELIKLACTAYREFQYNSSLSLRFLDGAKSASEKLIEYFQNIDFGERDNRGNPVFKIGEVTKALADTGKVLQGIETLRDKVEKEMNLNASKIRGGGKVNSREA